MDGLTEREKGLLLVAAVVLLATFYFMARIQPQTALVKSLKEEIGGLEQTLDRTPLPRNSGDPEAAQKQLDEAAARLDQARQELDALFRKRVDENSNQALEGLMLEILSLASAKGLSVDTSGVYAGSIADFGIIAKDAAARLQAGGGPFRFRPLRSLSLRGDYPQLQGFIKELPELRHEVNVLRFSIKSDGEKTGGQPPALHAELVLAL